MKDPNSPENEPKMTLWQVAQSVLAAAFGVQSSRNRERDFRRGSAKTFIIAGILATVLFVATVVLVVRLVLNAATG